MRLEILAGVSSFCLSTRCKTRRENIAVDECAVRHGAIWIWRGRCFTLWPDSIGLHPGRSRPIRGVYYRPICLPPMGPPATLPRHVFPCSLHSQIGGSRAHILHLSVLDTSVCAGPLTAPQRILRGCFRTPGFPHLHNKLSPPQKESSVLPESLDYTASSADPRRLTLLCNHHYTHNCFSRRVTGKSVLKHHTINAM